MYNLPKYKSKETLAVGMAHTRQGSEEGDRSLYDSSGSKRCDEMIRRASAIAIERSADD